MDPSRTTKQDDYTVFDTKRDQSCSQVFKREAARKARPSNVEQPVAESFLRPGCHISDGVVGHLSGRRVLSLRWEMWPASRNAPRCWSACQETRGRV